MLLSRMASRERAKKPRLNHRCCFQLSFSITPPQLQGRCVAQISIDAMYREKMPIDPAKSFRPRSLCFGRVKSRAMASSPRGTIQLTSWA